LSKFIAHQQDLASLQREFAKNRLVIIPNFLKPVFAERLYQSLKSLNDRHWGKHQVLKKLPKVGGERQAISQFLKIPITDHEKKSSFQRTLPYKDDSLFHLKILLNSQSMQQLLEDVTSLSFSKRSCLCFASRLRPGDFIKPHTDGSFPRRVAFVLYMTKGWKKSWGGNFFKRGRVSPVVPGFNSLLIFEVPTWHRVSRISERAANHQEGRQAVAGWFHDFSKSHLFAHAKSKGEIPYMIRKIAEK
jgi:Rps23 Pro-64 3,4-dihydroxylase Tpa1-like proline 4-hydroxylase